VSSKVTTSSNKQAVTVGGNGGTLWQNLVSVPNTPAGFTVKTNFDAVKNKSGMTTMMEMWQAGSAEPAHSHPGDDMTIVIEGTMKIQFFIKNKHGKLEHDGTPLTLNAGQTGYIASNRIHDATYVTDCKLVYVHSGDFGAYLPFRRPAFTYTAQNECLPKFRSRIDWQIVGPQ